MHLRVDAVQGEKGWGPKVVSLEKGSESCFLRPKIRAGQEFLP